MDFPTPENSARRTRCSSSNFGFGGLFPRSVVARKRIIGTHPQFPVATRAGHDVRMKLPRLPGKLNRRDFAAAVRQSAKLVSNQNVSMLRTPERRDRKGRAGANGTGRRFLLAVHPEDMSSFASPVELHVADRALNDRPGFFGFPGSVDQYDTQRRRASKQQTQTRDTGLRRRSEDADRSFSTRASGSDIDWGCQDYSTIAIGPVHQKSRLRAKV